VGGKLLDCCILEEDGIISRIGIDLRGDEELDLRKRGVVILPGLIDLHVHMRDFELSYKEDFRSGTMAAAAGGFTVVADMPNTLPPVNKPSVLRERERTARKKSFVDYALYYGVPESPRHLTDIVPELAVGVKIFMHREFYSEEKREMVVKTLEFVREKGMLAVVHAEKPGFERRTKLGLERAPEAEAEAIKEIAELSERTGFRLHITHISSALGAGVFAKAKKRGVSGDTSPHHLLLTKKDAEKIGGIAWVEPPLRDARDRDVLLKMLRRGIIDAVASDHAPHSLEEKLSDPPAPGFPSIEILASLMLTLVRRGGLRLEDFVRACSTRPAEILGLRRMGAIEEGMLANLTAVDLRKKFRIDPSRFISKAKFSPFAGKEVTGAPVVTIVRGKVVMAEGEIVGEEGWGKNVKTIC